MTPRFIKSGNGTTVLLLTIVLMLHNGLAALEVASSVTDRMQKAKEALEYVARIESAKNCTVGTGNTLSLNFNTSSWVTYTDPAIRTANFLTKLLAAGNTPLNVDESLLYNFVLNNVAGHTLIYGSAIALENSIIPDSYTTSNNRFCPYASKTPSGPLTAFDLGSAYDYTTDDTEWYAQIRARNFSGVEVVNDTITVNSAAGTYHIQYPVANLSHGRWTYPYYDCGGGNIWMVTYSSPILALNDQGLPEFQGVATIDLELTDIDINQCDADEDDPSGSLDVFRGTHNCQPTTTCEPIAHRGFNRGSYRCKCQDGYYFPGSSSSIKAYEGKDIERVFSSNSNIATTNSFRCLPCQRGCETCVDATPCLYEHDTAVRLLVVLIVVLLICGCLTLSVLTFKYRDERVMKTASPLFLQIMIYGAILMCVSMFLMYPEPTDILCGVFGWPFHMGFSLLYGSLLIKTWRIAVIFSSRKKVNLPDKIVLKRMLPLPLVMALYLICWSVLGAPVVTTITMENTKKFFSCPFNYWNYAAYGAEALLLLFGVYLCFTVRKAPAHFNESKHITWSTYNAIILGFFIITLTQFMSSSSGPDVVYVLLMLQLQVFVTITLTLVFAPKLWALYKGTIIDDGATATGRVKTNFTIPPSSNQDSRHVGTQVTEGDLDRPDPPSYQTVQESETPAGPTPSSRPLSVLRFNRVSPLPAAASVIKSEDVQLSSGPVNPVVLSPSNLSVDDSVPN